MHFQALTTTLFAGVALAATSAKAPSPYVSSSLVKASSAAASTSAAPTPGYDSAPNWIPSTVKDSSNLTFGRHYAVLNLDLINGIVGNVANTPAGKTFINNTATWINAVHAQNPPPLSIFTRIYFANAKKPEVKPGSAFAINTAQLTTSNTTATQLYPAFTPDLPAGDVVLAKTRYYAGAGNNLEQILASQSIDTVILSGIRTSGVILSTAYRLFDLDYKVYVIANNTIESPPNTPDINTNILAGILPKLPVNVITIEQALAALKRSGPAIY